jgi:hypothetical protein
MAVKKFYNIGPCTIIYYLATLNCSPCNCQLFPSLIFVGKTTLVKLFMELHSSGRFKDKWLPMSNTLDYSVTAFASTVKSF